MAASTYAPAHKAIVREILRCEVGSTAHGVNIQNTDDFDMMGVVVEAPQYVLGIDDFEQHIFRTAAERDGQHARSQPGDTDLVRYSLRKFARLAAQGNPTVLMLLFSPVLIEDGWGRIIRLNHRLFASKQVGKRFLGYLTNQKERLMGLRGQMDVKRPELVEKYGFDTKYAMHMLRLGYQGVEYMETGTFSVPLKEPIRSQLVGVRTGQQSLQDCLHTVQDLEMQLENLLTASPLPDKPNIEGINNMLNVIYREVWAHAGL